MISLSLRRNRLVRAEEALPRQLLRERAPTLRSPSLTHVAQCRADDADDVDPAVVVEALVLDRHDRANQVWRHAATAGRRYAARENGEGWLSVESSSSVACAIVPTRRIDPLSGRPVTTS